MTDLVTLKDFLVLCQTKSFSRAADRCHVSVSGLSRRIHVLEQWLGTPVFDRQKKALEVTDAGQRLQAIASEVVYAMEGLRKSVRADGEDQRLRVRFTAPHIMSAVFFADWIPRLHSDLENAKFSVDSDNLLECFARLSDGSSDYVVALFDQGFTALARIGVERDGGEFLMLDVGAEHLLPVSAPNAAGKPIFGLDGAGDTPISFLGYAEECHLGWALQPKLDSQPGLRLRQNHRASLTDGLRNMALSRLGVAWLPYSLVRDDLNNRRLVRAGGEHLDVPLRYVLIRRASPLPAQAERLWLHLNALTARAPARAADSAEFADEAFA